MKIGSLWRDDIDGEIVMVIDVNGKAEYWPCYCTIVRSSRRWETLGMIVPRHLKRGDGSWRCISA